MDKIICANCRHCERQRSNLEKNFNGTSIWIASLMLAMTDLYATKVVHATMLARNDEFLWSQRVHATMPFREGGE